MIKILIADDHPIIRSGLKQIISLEDDMIVSDEAETGLQTLELLKVKKYDILILDINFPDINGIEVLNKIKRNNYKIKVLVLSVLPEEQFAVKALEAGASGYLNKIAASNMLIKALRKIIEGGNYVSPELSDRIVSLLYHTDKQKVQHDGLSHREFEVMCMIASGSPIREIADKLLLSIPTVYTYRSKVLQKMKMKSDAEIIQYCFKEGIV